MPPDIEAITDLEYVSLFANGGDELYQFLYLILCSRLNSFKNRPRCQVLNFWRKVVSKGPDSKRIR